MTLSLRQKLTIISLLLYWSIIFALTHIPIPQLVLQAQVSDKSLHFIVYLILVFLLWFSLNPNRKVVWRKAAVWCVAGATMVYAIVDEVLQCMVNRSFDIMDIFANLSGVYAGLIVLSILTFWPSLLFVAATTIFLLTNIARANVAELIPVTSAVCCLVGYGFLTVLWLRNMHLWFRLKVLKPNWVVPALGLPAAFLGVVKLFSVVSGRSFAWTNVMTSGIGIIVSVGATYLIVLFRQLFRKDFMGSRGKRSV